MANPGPPYGQPPPYYAQQPPPPYGQPHPQMYAPQPQYGGGPPPQQWQPGPTAFVPQQGISQSMSADGLAASGLEAGHRGPGGAQPEWAASLPPGALSFGAQALGIGGNAEKMIDASATFVQQSYNRYLSGESLRYYFDVNQRYCALKLRMLFLPLLYKGHWNRHVETAGHGARFKAASLDGNAPDLYLPLMGLFTYCLLCAVSDWRHGMFGPERVARYLWWGCLAWAAQTAAFWVGARSLAAGGPGQMTLADAAATAGLVLVVVCAEVGVGLAGGRAYYAALAWGTCAYFVFLVKVLRRDLQRGAQGGTSKKVVVLVLALSQAPVALWLGRFKRK